MTQLHSINLMNINTTNRTVLFRNLERFTDQLNGATAGESDRFSDAERVYAIHIIEAAMSICEGMPDQENSLRHLTLHGVAAIHAARALGKHDGPSTSNPFISHTLRVAYQSL